MVQSEGVRALRGAQGLLTSNFAKPRRETLRILGRIWCLSRPVRRRTLAPTTSGSRGIDGVQRAAETWGRFASVGRFLRRLLASCLAGRSECGKVVGEGGLKGLPGLRLVPAGFSAQDHGGRLLRVRLCWRIGGCKAASSARGASQMNRGFKILFAGVPFVPKLRRQLQVSGRVCWINGENRLPRVHYRSEPIGPSGRWPHAEDH